MTDFEKKKLKLRLLRTLPLLLCAWAGNRIAYAWRISPGKDVSERAAIFVTKMLDSLLVPYPSFNASDLFWGAATAAVIGIVIYVKRKNAKKLRPGSEYGSARWGTEKEAEVLKDHTDFSNNVILTQTEFLTMGKPGEIKGGHYHPEAVEWFTVIEGNAVLRLEDIVTRERMEIPLNLESAKTIYVPNNVAHDFKNVGDTNLIVLA